MNLKQLSAVLCACAAGGALADVSTYLVQYLGDGTNATGLNEYGVVCGIVPTGSSTQRAAVWRGGQVAEL